MISIVPADDCTGCRMCGDVCPAGAIEFIDHSNGFAYPKVHADKCIQCERCYRKCPVYHTAEAIRDESGFQQEAYGAWSKDASVRENSTSGGIFSELAYQWFDNNQNTGECFGAIYNENLNVEHTICTSPQGIVALRQSKYVQSNTGGIYKKVAEELKKGKKVLFCGTPCQVVALKNYVGTNDPGLLCIDFICLGVASPKVYREYLQILEKKYHSKAVHVWFKNKKCGWHNLGTKVEFQNGKTYFKTGRLDRYMILFIEDFVSVRKSCTTCRFRNTRHISDITMGDFWGLDKTFPGLDDNKGISAVIINSDKGKALFEQVKEDVQYFPCTIDDIASGNPSLSSFPKKVFHQDAFFSLLNQKGLKAAMRRYSVFGGKERWRRQIKNVMVISKKRIKKTLCGEETMS